MADWRATIHALALSSQVAAGARGMAEKVLARAKQLDPTGDYSIEETKINVNGMVRVAYRVVNSAKDAVFTEFGAEGHPGVRPLGRAGRLYRG